MVRNSVFIFILALSVLMINQSIAQEKERDYGFGGAFGFINKVQFHSIPSKQTQMSVEVGNVLFDQRDFVVSAIGASFRYYLTDGDISNYMGFAISYINTDDDYLYYYVPLGLRAFANEKLSFFAGLNPGLYYPIGERTTFVLGVEVGAIIYFTE